MPLLSDLTNTSKIPNAVRGAYLSKNKDLKLIYKTIKKNRKFISKAFTGDYTPCEVNEELYLIKDKYYIEEISLSQSYPKVSILIIKILDIEKGQVHQFNGTASRILSELILSYANKELITDINDRLREYIKLPKSIGIDFSKSNYKDVLSFWDNIIKQERILLSRIEYDFNKVKGEKKEKSPMSLSYNLVTSNNIKQCFVLFEEKIKQLTTLKDKKVDKNRARKNLGPRKAI